MLILEREILWLLQPACEKEELRSRDYHSHFPTLLLFSCYIHAFYDLQA
jgi:hypothetical protein